MDRSALLDLFRTGYADVVDALAGITETDLDRPAPDGGWSPRWVAHHLADSEATAYVRLRRLIAEDAPHIAGYDEEGFAHRLHYDRPIAASLAVLAAVRAASLELLESLTPAEWERSGTHSESGPYTVAGWLGIYARHSHDHAEQIQPHARVDEDPVADRADRRGPRRQDSWVARVPPARYPQRADVQEVVP